MSTLTLWLAILGAGAVTFALRLSFIALLGRVEMPLYFGRALRFAGLFAALIAWRTKDVLFTLGGGMAALWALQTIGPI
jgi:branched-subunit amino acid transport protein